MPGIEMSCTHPVASKEINSLLEIIINWAGGNNEVDEDGDCPESYSCSNTTQPLITQNLMYTISSERLYAIVHKIFYQFDESINAIDYYKTIDHPPEIT